MKQVMVEPPQVVGVLSADELLAFQSHVQVRDDLRKQREDAERSLRSILRLEEMASAASAALTQHVANDHELPTDHAGYLLDYETGRILLVVRDEPETDQEAASPIGAIEDPEMPL